MKFSTSAEAFSFYKDMPDGILEARAQAIKADVAQNPECDIDAYRAELDALKAIRETRSEKVQKPEQRGQLRVIGGTEESKPEDVFATPEYRSAFFARAMGREMTGAQLEVMQSAEVERRANEFNSSSNSVAVLPTTTLNEVVRRAKDKGGIIAAARMFMIPTGIALPVGGPGSRAQWHVEGATVETEKFETTPVKFDGNELMRIFSVSYKVGQMSIPAFESEIVNELSDSVMEAIAYTLVHGTGEGEGMGLENGIEWTEGENLKTVDAASFGWRDLASLVGSLHHGYAQGARFAMSYKTLYNQVVTLHSDIDTPLYTPDINEPASGRIFGFPVTLDDYLADGEILFGDFQRLGYNLPAGIAIERSDQSGFRQGTVDFRGLAIADSQVILPEAFVKLQVEE